MKTKIISTIVVLIPLIFGFVKAEELKFYGNAELNICIPFDPSISFAAEGGLDSAHGNIEFKTDCNNSCYVSLLGARGGFGFGHTYTYQYGRFGLYFDCNETTKEEVIEDYCKEIEETIIDEGITKQCSGGMFSPDYWMCNLAEMHQYMHQNMNRIWNSIDNDTWNEFTYRFRYRYGGKKYIAVFEKNIDNKVFYDTYCKDDEYKKDVEICYNNENKTVKFYDVAEYIDNGAVLGKCKNTAGDVGIDDRCNLNTTIENGDIKINNDGKYRVKIKYLGGRFAYGTGFALRVTSRVKIGDNYFEAKGNYNNPLLGDVNYTGGTEIDAEIDGNINISIESTAWDLKDGWDNYSDWILSTYNTILNFIDKPGYEVGQLGSQYYYKVQNWLNPDYTNNIANWIKYKTVVGDKDSENTIVLKNGDSIDKILQYYDETVTGQPGVGEFIAGYIKDNKINIGENQLLYLFEFNDLTSCRANKTCDYQDTIMLIDINPITNNEEVDCENVYISEDDEDTNEVNNEETEDESDETIDEDEEENDEELELPSYLKVDYENSELIFDFAKNHDLKR